jgi:formylglycine-generating enzyme required for sulfatase activity
MNHTTEQALQALCKPSALDENTLLALQARSAGQEPPLWLTLVLHLHRMRQQQAPVPAPSQLLQAMAQLGQFCKHWTDTDGNYLDWHGGDAQAHLCRVGAHALLALGMSEGVAPPQPSDDAEYQAVTELAMRWLTQTLEAIRDTDPPNWTAPITPVHGTQWASARVLLMSGTQTGALGHVQLCAVHAPDAHLRLVPMPASACLLLDADFGQALNHVTLYLRHTLVDSKGLPSLRDLALAWDLAPAAGPTHCPGFASLHGDSAGAAFACAALRALAPYAPAALRSHLQLAAPLLPNAFVSAAIDRNGALRAVGGIDAKVRGFAPLAQALAHRPDQPHTATLYVASDQKVGDIPPEITPQPCDNVADILSHLAQRAVPLSADQEAFVSAGFADPEQLALALNDATRQEETEQLLNRLVNDVHSNPVQSVQHAAIQGVARWVRQAGGRLRHQFVPLRVQPDSTGAKSLPKAAREPFDRLPELLHLADSSAHRSYLLTGLPGAGKSVLLRRHMLECCERLLQAATANGDDTPALELPIYLPMDAFDLPDPPKNKPATQWWAEQAQKFTRATLTQYGWTTAMVEALLSPSGSTIVLPRARFQLDALNELPMPKNAQYTRGKRAESVVQGFLDAFSPHALKPLLSVRSQHFDVPEALPVEVMPWSQDRIRDYLTRYFGEPKAEELWPKFKGDTALLELCSRPMHMHMQCELIEAGYAPLATDRASLYLAHLWLRLRRALGHHGEGDTRQKPNKDLDHDSALLTLRDRQRIERTKPGRIDAESLRDLPTQGFLLRGLMQQAEHQYWADTESGKDSRERCSVSVRIEDIHLKASDGAPISEDLRDRWIAACAALDLLEKDAANNKVKFSHQSWGEFFASLRLLDTPPDELERQAKAGVPGAQDKWARATQRPFVHLSQPVSAEAERRALRERVNQRWAPVLPRLQRFLAQNQGRLSVDMATLKVDGTVNMPEADDAQVVQRYTAAGWVDAGLLEFPEGQGMAVAHLDLWVEKLGIASAVGLVPGAPWAADGAACQALLVGRLWSCFEEQVWAHLRQGDESGPGLNDEAEQLLRQEPGHIALPATSDVQEVLQLALQSLTQKQAEAWLAHWLTNPPRPQAWRVLAPAALALQARLEPPDAPGVVGLGMWHKPHHLLQHLRRWLLLASVDAGEPARERVQAAGVSAALQAPVSGLPPAIEAAWASPCAAAFAGEGLDLLLRLQAGLLLGELGDNIRYERWPVKAEGRVGIRLKAAHWALVPEGELPVMRFAQTPAVVMQWQAYVQDLQARGEQAPKLWAMDQSRFNNPLQAITSLDWFTARAFTDWMAPLHAGLFPELDGTGEDQKARLALPTEVQHEAAVRYNPADPHPARQAKWPHDPSDQREPDQMPPDLFNHNRTRWDAPAPVGVFSAALTPSGIEAMGNVWAWCANVKTDDYQGKNARQANRPYTATPEEWREEAKAAAAAGEEPPLLALRGGSFDRSAGLALAAYRLHDQPGLGSNNIGLRWVMCRPIP